MPACKLCSSKEDTPSLGKLQKYKDKESKKAIWFHSYCLSLSGIQIDGRKVSNVETTLETASQRLCSFCQNVGATARCQADDTCTRTFHLPCALKTDCYVKVNKNENDVAMKQDVEGKTDDDSSSAPSASAAAASINIVVRCELHNPDKPIAQENLTSSALYQRCVSLLDKLMEHPDCWPFLEPVDPIALNIPTYFDVIKTPMDLGTIKDKLENTRGDGGNDNEKSKANYTTEAFAADLRLVWKNCITFNAPDSPVFIMAQDLQEICEFELATKIFNTRILHNSSENMAIVHGSLQPQVLQLSEKPHDPVCHFCEIGDKTEQDDFSTLIACAGNCRRIFHGKSCLQRKERPMDGWVCDDCTFMIGECGVCNEYCQRNRWPCPFNDEDPAKLIQCANKFCSRWFHRSCRRDAYDSNECGQHTCYACKGTDEPDQMIRCKRFGCVKAYHIRCLPRQVDGKEEHPPQSGSGRRPMVMNGSKTVRLLGGHFMLCETCKFYPTFTLGQNRRKKRTLKSRMGVLRSSLSRRERQEMLRNQELGILDSKSGFSSSQDKNKKTPFATRFTLPTPPPAEILRASSTGSLTPILPQHQMLRTPSSRHVYGRTPTHKKSAARSWSLMTARASDAAPSISTSTRRAGTFSGLATSPIRKMPSLLDSSMMQSSKEFVPSASSSFIDTSSIPSSSASPSSASSEARIGVSLSRAPTFVLSENVSSSPLPSSSAPTISEASTYQIPPSMSQVRSIPFLYADHRHSQVNGLNDGVSLFIFRELLQLSSVVALLRDFPENIRHVILEYMHQEETLGDPFLYATPSLSMTIPGCWSNFVDSDQTRCGLSSASSSYISDCPSCIPICRPTGKVVEFDTSNCKLPLPTVWTAPIAVQKNTGRHSVKYRTRRQCADRAEEFYLASQSINNTAADQFPISRSWQSVVAITPHLIKANALHHANKSSVTNIDTNFFPKFNDYPKETAETTSKIAIDRHREDKDLPPSKKRKM